MNFDALSEQLILLFVLIFVAYFASKVKLLPANANSVIADLVVNTEDYDIDGVVNLILQGLKSENLIDF